MQLTVSQHKLSFNLNIIYMPTIIHRKQINDFLNKNFHFPLSENKNTPISRHKNQTTKYKKEENIHEDNNLNFKTVTKNYRLWFDEKHTQCKFSNFTTNFQIVTGDNKYFALPFSPS